MDPLFSDQMQQLGDLSSEIISSRWSAVTDIAKSADNHQRARLVLFMCRKPINRERDEWFWAPFRDAEQNFKVEDAVEIHSRLAAAAVGHLISQGDLMASMLVRLSTLAGLEPVFTTVPDAANNALAQPRGTSLPHFTPPKEFWFKENQDTVKTPGGAALEDIGSAIDTVAIRSQSSLKAIASQTQALTAWAVDAERRFTNEQLLVQWLLGGTRDDGAPWTSLQPAVIAIDGASELLQFIDGIPQRRHESALAQLLTTSAALAQAVSTQQEFEFKPPAIKDDALALLTPICEALRGGNVPDDPPLTLAVRLLWEAKTIAFWSEE